MTWVTSPVYHAAMVTGQYYPWTDNYTNEIKIKEIEVKHNEGIYLNTDIKLFGIRAYEEHRPNSYRHWIC